MLAKSFCKFVDQLRRIFEDEFLKMMDDFCSKHLVASLDVKSLFTNVPVDFIIDLIINNIFHNGLKDFNGL